MLEWLLLLMPLAWLVVFRSRRRRLYELAAVIPTSKEALPVIGVAHTLVGSTEKIMMTLQRLSYESMQNNGILTSWLGHILYFVVVNPEDLEVVLKTCLEKDDLHRFIRKIIGYGGIFAPVSIWRRRRKIMVPAFSPKIVDSFVHVFSEQSELLANHLTNRPGAGKFQLWPFLSTCSLDSICQTTMGVTISAQGNPDSPFLNAMSRIMNLVCERIFHLWLQPDWLYKLFPQYKQHQKELTVMHAFTDEVIKKKRKEIELEKEKKTDPEIAFDLGMYGNQTFLDLLITNSGGEKGYTNIELREEILTLIIAGTDTSAQATGYTLKLLAQYPQIQEKVYQELYEIFRDSDRPLMKEDLTNMKYLERVIKESLRLYPPVPFIIRKVLEEITLPSGRTLPAGSGVAVSIWGVHRDPKYWGPDAEHFDPDRFLPERFKLVNPCSFMPFSYGPRNCLVIVIQAEPLFKVLVLIVAMQTSKLKGYIEKSVKLRKYNNIVESLYLTKFIRKIFGMSVLIMKTAPDDRIVTEFTWLGFIFFVTWHSLYFYCAYKAHIEEQGILQSIYNTKMQRYGDDFERVISLVYVLIAMWKLPFSLSGDSRLMQIIVDVDKELENLGETVDYNQNAFISFLISIGQVGVYLIRMLCIWLTLTNLNVPFPAERMFQVVFSDAIALIITSQYCYSLIVLRCRFKFINKILNDIKSRESWEYKIFVRSRMTVNTQRAGDLKDKYICEKIRACARVYGMLCRGADVVNKMFGLGLMMNVFVSVVYIILHLFYFLEATVAGLFHDIPRYIDFLLYVFWQIGYATGIIFLIVFFCERAMCEAKNTSFITHEIINSDFSSIVTNEAMQLSIQLLHQRPVFTACGIYKLEYPLFQEGVRSVSTYLIILLQFVTDKQ